MRIIDKNHDFYDFLSDPTDTLVFDRRNSHLLTKEVICRSIIDYWIKSNYRFLTLQCGSTFWLFLLTVTTKNHYNLPSDYTLELLSTWKNYDKPNKLLNLSIVEFYYSSQMKQNGDYSVDLVKKNVPYLIDCINRNDYKEKYTFSTEDYFYDKNGKKQTKLSFPLLKACGISSVVNITTLFYAIEEYFSIEKMKLETTEPKGATNNDKIIMHGFDTVVSFRGKN